MNKVVKLRRPVGTWQGVTAISLVGAATVIATIFAVMAMLVMKHCD